MITTLVSIALIMWTLGVYIGGDAYIFEGEFVRRNGLKLIIGIPAWVPALIGILLLTVRFW
jgi:hypothetical protein